MRDRNKKNNFPQREREAENDENVKEVKRKKAEPKGGRGAKIQNLSLVRLCLIIDDDSWESLSACLFQEQVGSSPLVRNPS